MLSVASAPPLRLLVAGASRGIGAAVAAHRAARGDTILAVSRGRPPVGQWVPADLAKPEGIAAVAAAVGPDPLDALLFMGGTWEAGAFTDAFDFAASPDAETRHVLAVNLIAPIELTKALTAALRMAPNPRIVLMGSESGRDGRATAEVANTASKFGLRGAAQALRPALAGTGIGVTVINPGNVATDEVVDDIAAGRFGPQVPIPLADLAAVVDLILSLSPAADLAEVDLRQKP
jgi:3-oxoacyl-[acyl-carrier protein] reductase